eukprot:TRINITY_DN11164_c0_g1_i1.p1 TRINITY_DN11164_c0_g1~~TRINITY_DN11164_c0_g1_i1.p1  ORF type:complete len:482 (+),score=155.79 TRINITY_DN11164_c0_g1_i1:161-1606(+)
MKYSFVSGRNFKKLADKLWEKYQAVKDNDEKDSDSESSLTQSVAQDKEEKESVKEAEKKAESDEDSSSLESLSSSDASGDDDDDDVKEAKTPVEKEVVEAKDSEKESDTSSSLGSLSDDDDEENEPKEKSEVQTGLSKEDQYIISQGWADDAESVAAFKNARNYTKKYLPMIEEAMKNNATAAPAATTTTTTTAKKDKRKFEEAEDATPEETPEAAPKIQKVYGTTPGDTSECLLMSMVPDGWYDPTADKSIATKEAYEKALKGMDKKSREAGVLIRKLSELEPGDKGGFAKKVIEALGEGGSKVATVRPLCVNDRFVGACVVRYDSPAAASAAFNTLLTLYAKPATATTVTFPYKATLLTVSLTSPPPIPEPYADGLFTPIILAQPPDVPRLTKKKQFDRKKEATPWWEGTYSKKEGKDEAQVEKEEKQKEAVAAAKTFTEYIMAKMGLDQESLDSYLSSRKFIKVKEQLENEYQESLKA